MGDSERRAAHKMKVFSITNFLETSSQKAPACIGVLFLSHIS
jgi:hypothetical protein